MPKKITTLYKELLEIEDDIKETYELFEKRDKLLEQIFKRNKGPQEIKHANIENGFWEIRLVEVVEQKGH